MPIDLKAYAGRIEHKGQLAPNLATLQALHLAHATHITFENLDVLMGKPIRLDLESLAAKLIQGGRGGYCFEQNALFAGALEEIGFRVTRLAARVRMGSQKITPRMKKSEIVLLWVAWKGKKKGGRKGKEEKGDANLSFVI